MDDVPAVRLLRGETPEPLLMRTVHRRTGTLRWNLLKASALRDESGTIVATRGSSDAALPTASR